MEGCSKTLRIEEEYTQRHKASKALYEKARNLFPRGVTHDSRYMKPFPIYVTRAKGCRKWDVDGNEYIDYWMGHGALILGHLHPIVTEAVLEQAKKGTHYGASHELEIQWAEKITKLVPSARGGFVEFTSSGTEATSMALRLARAYTGNKKIVRFAGHFHGWHDYLLPGYQAPYKAGGGCAGIPEEALQNIVVIPPNNVEALEDAMRDGDVAGIILEPSGASMGHVPMERDFLRKLRSLTDKYQAVLIFDEVVTGFRDAPGGAQEAYGIVPDLTTLGKIVGGGYPGAAVAGKRDIMGMLDYELAPKRSRLGKVLHPGTFNANPQSAAAGNACLGIIAEGKVNPYVNALGENMKKRLNEVFDELGIKGMAWGGSPSIVNIGFGITPEDIKVSSFDDLVHFSKVLGNPGDGALNKAMINHGVHFMGQRAILSVAHTETDIDFTINAFRNSLKQMLDEGLLNQYRMK